MYNVIQVKHHLNWTFTSKFRYNHQLQLRRLIRKQTNSATRDFQSVSVSSKTRLPANSYFEQSQQDTLIPTASNPLSHTRISLPKYFVTFIDDICLLTQCASKIFFYIFYLLSVCPKNIICKLLIFFYFAEFCNILLYLILSSLIKAKYLNSITWKTGVLSLIRALHLELLFSLRYSVFLNYIGRLSSTFILFIQLYKSTR